MPENRNSMLFMLIAFAAGTVVGANWPKVKKLLEPYTKKMGKKGAEAFFGDAETFFGDMVKFFAEQKERMDDSLAEAKVIKINEGKGIIRKRRK